jgi:nucleoid DNA-binding protein
MDKYIDILSKKYNLDSEVIEKIVRSEFLFVKDMIEVGELDSVHLHHLGKFAVKSRYTKNLSFKQDDN